MCKTVSASLRSYLENPSPAGFVSLQAAVAASADYAPYTDSPDLATALMNEGKFVEAESLLRNLLSNYLLSPRMHRFLWFALDQQGDQEKALLEFGMAKYCLEGILSTGPGGRERPYSVLHVEDEYDVL